MVEIALAHTDEEVDRALSLAEQVWGAPPVSRPIARALTFAGWYVATAADDGDLVGMCAGFVGVRDDGLHLHSHLAAVLPSAQGRGIGRDLKRHQRAWCLERGIEHVSWTFDPLVRENARFNLHHLGAVGDRYIVDLYGAMDDEINRGQPSDRLLVHWDLTSERTTRALEAPLPTPPPDPAGVPTPEAIVALRGSRPDEALRWRHEVRAAMVEAFATGRRPTAIDADGRYVFTTEER
ncbi:GNAT family N-acetyltransferase [Actinospongicola halichondriae]|uniref:GNAT family N-acetyltransferase n=1 Tax=Actinospongicola halichondriae TaxID=3236844 RepID=UPI003D48CEF3